MQGIKGTVVLLTLMGAAIALSACRREVPPEPMKLGADIPVAEKVAR